MLSNRKNAFSYWPDFEGILAIPPRQLSFDHALFARLIAPHTHQVLDLGETVVALRHAVLDSRRSNC